MAVANGGGGEESAVQSGGQTRRTTRARAAHAPHRARRPSALRTQRFEPSTAGGRDAARRCSRSGAAHASQLSGGMGCRAGRCVQLITGRGAGVGRARLAEAACTPSSIAADLSREYPVEMAGHGGEELVRRRATSTPSRAGSRGKEAARLRSCSSCHKMACPTDRDTRDSFGDE